MSVASGVLGSWRGRLLAGAIVLALAAGTVAASRAVTSPPAEHRTEPVKRGTVTQTVLVAGQVDASASVKVNFKASGKLARVMVAVGQTVAAGQTLAVLDTTDLGSALARAKADLASAQARYDQTLAGASAEDVAVAQQAVSSARRSLDETRRTAANDLASAQQAFTRLRSAYTSEQNAFSLLTSGVETDAATFTRGVDDGRTILANTVIDLSVRSTADLTSAKNSIGQADAALVNAQGVAATQVKSTLAEWKGARDNAIAGWLQFDGAIQRGTDTSGATSAYRSAQLAYTTAASRLLTALDLAEAQVSSASAAITLAQNALNSSNSRTDATLDTLRADFAGFQNAMSGETQLETSLKSKATQAGTSLATVTDAIGGSYVAAQQAVTSAQERGASAIQTAQNASDAAVAALAKTSAGPRPHDVDAARASVLAQQAAVDRAKDDLANATLAAPSAGVVAQVNVQPGELVVGGGSPTGSIVLSNTASVLLRGTVGERHVTRLALGQAASVSVEALGAGTVLTGRITSIGPVAASGQGVPAYGVDVTIDDPKGTLRPGMTGLAQVVVASRSAVLTVRNIAIRAASGRRSVQVLVNGAPVDTEVTLGLAGEDVTEVTSGLQEGQLVVLPPVRGASAGSAAIGGASLTFSATGPFLYPAITEPALERVAVVVRITNETEDDLLVDPSDLVARDEEHRLYPSDPLAGVADARLVRAVAALRGMSGVRPLTRTTLRRNDVLTGFVVFVLPEGVRPTQVVFRQTDADHVADLTAR